MRLVQVNLFILLFLYFSKHIFELQIKKQNDSLNYSRIPLLFVLPGIGVAAPLPFLIKELFHSTLLIIY
jgi:putative effector of murein hydrolase LrgA (UPF0299 family)